MSTGEDEPLIGLNGRLRPRKLSNSSLQTNIVTCKSDGKTFYDKPKKCSTPSKVSPNKTDDLIYKSDNTPILQILCPYCDKKFISKQTALKHARRIHISSLKQDSFISCLFCNHAEAEINGIIRHMVDRHPNQYFACLDCHTRFPSTRELAEHKLNVCEKQKLFSRSKLRQKSSDTKKSQKFHDGKDSYHCDNNEFPGQAFNGIVISCELKPSHVHDEADIEDNITTNLILPSTKGLSNSTVIEKNAVIVLDDIQWNKRIPSNFSFHNTDADQILTRLGVVHRSPRTGESTRKDWLKTIDDATQKFEKCFDTSFYSKVASNVQENLSKFLDGSFNFNPDPDSTIKTRKAKNSVAINTAEGFPILLACEQYSRNIFDGYMPRAIAPKHKWKWDNLENDKNVFNPDQIKCDSHVNNCIITLVSSLDIWTQLCMRRKFEDKFSNLRLEKKTEKLNIVSKELKEILESREITVKSSQITKYKPVATGDALHFPTSLGLTPNVPAYDLQPAVLSGEWVRPRCYVCCACGAQTHDCRALSSHISMHHPNAMVQHYEIVGEPLLNADILKHLYVPPSQTVNRTRPLRGIRDCTKCQKSITLEDLHQHMLDCAGDTPAVRRKCRYRPFGVRKRRPRIPDRIRRKMRKDIRTGQANEKNYMRPRPRNRTEVGDAETIRKMLADLPAKRHRVVINPTNSLPRKKLDRKLMMKRRSTENRKYRNPGEQPLRTENTDCGSSGNPYERAFKKDDDAPLKHNIKQVIRKRSHHKESLNKKSVMNRPKRKPITGKGFVIKNDTEIPINSCEINQSQQLSIDQTTKRINVNRGPCNIRERGNRGGSNNRDDQQPGSSRQNGNSHDSNIPSESVPLKHSIARLTADSETHDKSVQFHRLFLVQQECNNTNQHVLSDRRVLFENEAVVTKLDKPPLHFNQKTIMDSQILRKNKSNKPRKGLNDCIAMLKNKLVDANQCATYGHVSVQCGSDEPIESDIFGVEPISMLIVPKIDDPQKSTEILSSCTIKSPTLDKTVNDVNIEEYGKTYHLKQKPHKTDIEKSNDKICLANKKLPEFNNPMKEYDKQSSPEQINDIQKEAECNLFIEKESECISSLPKHELLTQRLERTEVEPRKTDLMQILPPQRNTVIKKSPKATAYVSLKDETKTLEIRHLDSESIVSVRQGDWQESCTENLKSNKLAPEKYQTQSSELVSDINIIKAPSYITGSQCNLISDSLMEVSTHKVYSPSISSPIKSVNIEIHCETQNVIETQINVDLSHNDIIDSYSSNNFIDVPVDIPRAHASTSVESIVSTPLDLSGKTINLDIPENSSTQDMSFIMTSYNNYETLDLSNKSVTDHSIDDDTDSTGDIVVDLSIKSCSQFGCQSRPANMHQQLTINDDTITDLSYGSFHEYTPTDLSIKKKNQVYAVSIDENIEEIQDLSNQKNKNFETVKKNMQQVKDLRNDMLGDLSRNESSENLVAIELIPSEYDSNVNYGGQKSDSMELLIDTSNEIEKNCCQPVENPIKLGSDVAEPVSQINDMNILQENNNPKFIHCNDIDKPTDTSQFQQAFYDPSLRMMPFRIRRNSIHLESIDNKNIHFSEDFDTSSECYSIPYSKPTVSMDTYTYITVVSDSTVGSVITSTPDVTHEKSSSEYENVSLNVTPMESNPMYIHKNQLSPNIPINKIECTSPVYTISDACIPITKIDSNNVVSLAKINKQITMPGTSSLHSSAIANDITKSIATTLNPKTIMSACNQINKNECLIISSESMNSPEIEKNVLHTSIDSHKTNEEKMDLKIGEKIYVDSDTERARKIAMLPKELVEILGTMPLDHRNQLLNVLPQYVSTSAPVSLSDTAQYFKNNPLTNSINTLSVEKPNNILALNCTAEGTVENKNDSYSVIEPVKLSSNENISISPVMSDYLRSSPVQSQSKITNPTVSGDIKLCSPEISHGKRNSLTFNSFLAQKNYISEEGTKGVECILQDDIIDLTEEENIQQNRDNIAIPECPVNKSVKLIEESSDLDATTKCLKQKGKIDQTASLRAVRIKAPSERLKPNPPEHHIENIKQIISPANVTNNKFSNLCDDTEEVTNLDINMTLAIQQAEVSSTQHGNKNVLVDCKFQLLASPTVPNSTLASNDLSHNKAQVNDQVTLKLDTERNICDENLVVKSGLVTSSLRNEIRTINIQNTPDVTLHSDLNDTSKPSTSTSKSTKTSCETFVIDKDIIVLDVYDPNLCKYQLQENSNAHVEELDGGTPTFVGETLPIGDEDSDDDITLAVIVKQKQLDLLKSSFSERNPTINVIANMIRDDINKNSLLKDNDKLSVNQSSNVKEIIPITTFHQVKEFIPVSPKNIIDMENVNTIIKDERNRWQISTKENDPYLPENNEHIFKRKTRQNTFVAKFIEQKTDKIQEYEQCKFDLNKENEISSESSKKINSVEDTCRKKLLDKDYSCNTGRENRENSPNDDSEISKRKINLIENIKLLDESMKTKTGQVQAISSDYITINNENSTQNEFCLQKIKPIFYSSSNHYDLGLNKNVTFEQSKHSTYSGTSDLIPNYDQWQRSITKESSVPCDTDSQKINQFQQDLGDSDAYDSDSKTKKTTRFKKLSDTEPVETVLPRSVLEKGDIAPLRRSRRGKSLFMESKLPVIENTNQIEYSIEHKAPLTKKQLIFSKLLLDEENAKPKLPSALTKEREGLKNTQISSNDLINITVEENISISSEKIKSNKRKISPQPKLKCKKKKSLHSSTHEIDDGTTSRAIDRKNGKDHEKQPENEEQQSKLLKINEKTDEKELNSTFDETNQTEIHKSHQNSALEEELDTPFSREKRKMCCTITSYDEKPSSKPKKSKSSNKVESKPLSDIHKISDREKLLKSCYNSPPIAARRTRSKSVVVKSSTPLYDPYDIDLEDMIERSESSRKMLLSSNHSFTKLKLGSEHDKKKRKKSETSIGVNTEPLMSDEFTGKLMSSDVNESNNHVSDSDESSKSDIPLKKYAEEKEKKNSNLVINDRILQKEHEKSFEIHRSNVSKTKQKIKNHKKSRHTEVNVINDEGRRQHKTEEQIRSEQFMESFGFFSERKPRKSNLLASKKISETFHIIANEKEDVYFTTKERVGKRSSRTESRKVSGHVTRSRDSSHSPNKKSIKRRRKKASCSKLVPCFCSICNKEFRRADNYLRHQMTLLHISKLSEVEMKIKTVPVVEEPNYLVAYKQQLNRIKMLKEKIASRKKNSKSTSKIKLPTLEEILINVNRAVRDQQLCRRGLSQDEALFLDCCELLKESHKSNDPNAEIITVTSNGNSIICSKTVVREICSLDRNDDKSGMKRDDVDVTAKTILESEEVRNLENDLISGLNEAAACASNSNFQQVKDGVKIDRCQEVSLDYTSKQVKSSSYENMESYTEVVSEPVQSKSKKHHEVKEKMYPDVIENIDMFEDKFDKIKRKCRSQAAAAKQIQTVVESTSSYKVRKKSDKKKGKKSSKKNYQNTVLTKGALKGFDGIKVSIPTSDINMTAIVPAVESSLKKKKKVCSKKKKEIKTDIELISKYNTDYQLKSSQQVDVYEFMDNEDAELFEFRPSTLMERFKSINSKSIEMPSTSKCVLEAERADISSESGSDGDDFVYDDYVCTDDETENSLMSCELGSGKVGSESKKNTLLKRKDAVEKNAVMGKIFKHNAVRTEKKSSKVKEPPKPKANLDQLFDSLLEGEPRSASDDSIMSGKKDEFISPSKYETSPKKHDMSTKLESITSNSSTKSPKNEIVSPKKLDAVLESEYDYKLSTRKRSSTPSKEYLHTSGKKIGPNKNEVSSFIVCEPSTSKTRNDEDHHSSKKHDMTKSKERKNEEVIDSSTKKHHTSSSKNCDVFETKVIIGNDLSNYCELLPKCSKDKSAKERAPIQKTDKDETICDYGLESMDQDITLDDAGVARQRARRKCTVGKQNVLAETWSSESEPDGGPPRPNSAESVVSVLSRKKKGKKKEGHPCGMRRINRQMPIKRQDVESRVALCNQNILSGSGVSSGSRSGGSGTVKGGTSASGIVNTLGTIMSSPGPLAPLGPPNVKIRPRSAAYYWSSEGDEEQEHLQQHGWIVGDSHKKLVTMLAHAKGRKRNTDEKRHVVE